MNRIPFKLSDQGLSEIKGMIYVDGRFLVMQIQQSLLGLIETDRDVFKVAPTALAEIRHKRGLFGDRLLIKPTSVDLLDTMPGEHLDCVELKIRRKYRSKVDRLLDEVQEVVDAEERSTTRAGDGPG